MSPREMLVGLGSLDPGLLDRLDADLGRVETSLLDGIVSEYPFVTEASRHLAAAGGKRFRPLLVLLAAQFGDPEAPGIVPAAVVVELTHLATLYHDDVMDEAQIRRGARSANARWDNTVAILTGDFLFARASDILADLGPDAVRIQARTFERLCTGQILETIGAQPGEDPVEHHLRVLADKTGSLIATSGRFGAMMSGAPEGIVETMTRFGEDIGVAFQLADDLVDITSETAQSGKTPGTDLREGVPTLAGLMVLSRGEGGRLADLLSRPLPDDGEHREALDLLRADPALEEARAVARSWADRARARLSGLPDAPATRALETLCDYVVGRSG